MAEINGQTIDLLPTEGMREEAQRYREWKAEGRPGGTEVAARRAGQILSGDELSPETVITMAAWFARHEVDKQGEGFSPDEDGYPSPGRVAWAAWGGDAGQSWATSKAETIKNAEDRALTMARPYPTEHAARLKDPDQFEQFRRETDGAGPGIDIIWGITDIGQVEMQALRFDAARYSEQEARDWLAEHDMKPIAFEAATLRQCVVEKRVEVRELNRDPLHRVVSLDYQAALVRMEHTDAADEQRTFEFSFSSEAPVERWFGTEILSHADGAVDLSRLNDGAPLLWNHNPDDVLGVIERGWTEDGRGRVRVRFARSAFADEKLQMVKDRILRNVSVGYSILDAAPIRDGNGIVATSWQPHEVSVVSVPADATVGFGRSFEDDAAAALAATPQPPDNNPMEPTIDLEAVRAQAAADERSRVAAITGLCREHGADDLAQGLIERGASESEAMREVLAQIAKRAKQPAQAATPAASAQPIARSADIGLSDKEARSFSFLRAIRAQLMPNDRQAQEDAAFEREASTATVQHMARCGYEMQARGFVVPNDVLRRDLTAGTAATAGDLIFTDARPGSFIEVLRKRNALAGLGITVLSGLTGPVAIPRQTGESQVYWKGEGVQGTQTEPTVGQVTMTLKEMSAWTRFSRSLVLQSSIDVETMVRNELATVAGLEQARVGLYGLGSSSQPEGLKFTTGINTKDFSADQPTYAELVNMETLVAADDADIDTMNYITNATIYGGFKTTEKATSTAQFVLEPGGTVNSYGVVRSNQVATGDVWFGVWSQLVLGLFGAIDLQVNPYSEDREGNVRVTIHQAIDYACKHPEAFCRGNNTL